MQFIHHTIHLFKACNSVVSNVSQTCVTISTINYRIFSSLKRSSVFISSHFPFPPSCGPRKPLIYYLSLYLTLSYEWNHTVCGLDMISIFLNLLRFDLWPKMWSILENIPYAPEKKVYSSAFGWNVLKISLGSFLSNVSFKTCVSLLIFCFDDLSIGVSGC